MLQQSCNFGKLYSIPRDLSCLRTHLAQIIPYALTMMKVDLALTRQCSPWSWKGIVRRCYFKAPVILSFWSIFKVWIILSHSALAWCRCGGAHLSAFALHLVTKELHWCGKWVSGWLNLTASLGTADSEVHIVHITRVSWQKGPTRHAYLHGRYGPFGRIPAILSRVIIAYTLESLSSLTYITHNLQATIYS